MRRALLIAALATAAMPAAAGAAPLPVRVKVAACSVEDHAAAFSARMEQIPGATRMAMRFTLLPGPFAPSVEERIVGKVHELVKRVRKE